MRTGCAAGPVEGAAGEPITVKATDTACELSRTEAPAGQVEFTVTNAGSKVNEFYVYAEGDRIVGEVENVSPGLTRSFHVELSEPGDQDAIVQPFLAKWFPSLRTLIRTSPDMDAMVSVLDPAWNEVLPTSYLVDRNGRVAGRMQGGKSRAEFEAAILPLLGTP